MIRILEKMRSLSNGGIEAVVFGLTLNISNTDLEISYCTDSSPDCRKWERQAENLDRKIFSLDRGANGLIKRFLYVTDFYSLCRKEHFDIVHIHMYGAYDAVYIFAARLAGVKKIIRHSHFGVGADINFFKKIFNSFFKVFGSAGNDICIACSESAGKYMFPKSQSGKYILLNNGIDTEAFAYSVTKRQTERAERGFDRKFAVGNIGRLSELKNQGFLIDVFYELLKIRENSVLVIAGDGGLSESLKLKTNALGISDKVMFLGDVDDASALYQALDCFVFPSISEGLGIAAIEAQASGLVTVCSDGVPKEAAVTELCSFMPLSASPREWAEHIISRTSGYERKSYADEVRAAGYDIRDTAEQLEKIYLSLAEE